MENCRNVVSILTTRFHCLFRKNPSPGLWLTAVIIGGGFWNGIRGRPSGHPWTRRLSCNKIAEFQKGGFDAILSRWAAIILMILFFTFRLCNLSISRRLVRLFGAILLARYFLPPIYPDFIYPNLNSWSRRYFQNFIF